MTETAVLNPRFARRERTRETRAGLFVDAQKAILRRIAEPQITVTEIAKELLVSRRQLQRCFEQHETSFSGEVSRLRIRLAAKLLRDDPELRVSEVMEQVGLTHRSNFAKAFRQRFGKTPTQWRDEHRARLHIARITGQTY